MPAWVVVLMVGYVGLVGFGLGIVVGGFFDAG